MKSLAVVIAASAAFLLAGARPNAVSPPFPADGTRITIAAAGDAMAHSAILRCAARNSRGARNDYGFDYLFERLKPYVETADIAVVNAEFPVPDRVRRRRKQYIFGAPIGIVRALKWAGFDVANIANNHAFDQKTEGVADTVAAFERVGLASVGAGRTSDEAEAFRIVEINGVKVAFISASRILNPERNSPDPSMPRVNYFEIEKMLQWIRAAKQQANIVVVNVHWGREGALRPEPEDEQDALRMMDAGADLVIGHHSHILQKVIIYNAPDGAWRLAAMSMGNLVSNQRPNYKYGYTGRSYGDPRDGALLFVTFESRGRRMQPVSWNVLPLWTWNDRLDPDVRKHYPWNIQVWPIPDAINRINTELAGRGISQSKRVYLIRLKEDLARRSEYILRRMGAESPSRVGG